MDLDGACNDRRAKRPGVSQSIRNQAATYLRQYDYTA
jgi:hypothetical protein